MLLCTIMHTLLKLHETSIVALWLILVPYLNMGPVPGKTKHAHTMLTKSSSATVTFHKIAHFLHSAPPKKNVLKPPYILVGGVPFCEFGWGRGGGGVSAKQGGFLVCNQAKLHQNHLKRILSNPW